MKKKFLKIPTWYLRYTRTNKDFLFVLLWLYRECNYTTGEGKFTLAEIMHKTYENPSPARWKRLRNAIDTLIHECGVVTLRGSPDIHTVKPRQLVHVERFNYNYFYDLEKGFVLIPNSHIEKMIFSDGLIEVSDDNFFANVYNVYFEVMVKLNPIQQKTNFRLSAVAEILKISVEQARDCVIALRKAEIFKEIKRGLENGVDLIYLQPIYDERIKE